MEGCALARGRRDAAAHVTSGQTGLWARRDLALKPQACPASGGAMGSRLRTQRLARGQTAWLSQAGAVQTACGQALAQGPGEEQAPHLHPRALCRREAGRARRNHRGGRGRARGRGGLEVDVPERTRLKAFANTARPWSPPD